MKSTLRDEYFKNITVSGKMLCELNTKLISIVNQINRIETDEKRKLWITYIVRFDKKGRSIFAFEEAINCYKNAQGVERFLFAIDCIQSFQNKMFGKSIDIRFDILDINNCRLVVQGDDSTWVDNTYSSLIEIINKYKNWNAIVRNSAIPFLVQIAGVFLGVLLSIKGAQALAPRLKIEYALPFSFVIVFLLFSNIWTYLYNVLLRAIDKLWPNITFKEKQNILSIIFRWMLNIILGFIFLVGVKTVFSLIVNLCTSILK